MQLDQEGLACRSDQSERPVSISSDASSLATIPQLAQQDHHTRKRSAVGAERRAGRNHTRLRSRDGMGRFGRSLQLMSGGGGSGFSYRAQAPDERTADNAGCSPPAPARLGGPQPLGGSRRRWVWRAGQLRA